MGNPQLSPRINLHDINHVLDGSFEYWPEGASRLIASGGNAYGSVLQRFYNVASGINITNSQQAGPSASLQFSNHLAKTSAGSLAAGTGITMEHYIEGYNMKKLLDDEFSVIFWVKSSVASKRSVSIKNGNVSHSYVQQYTINQADTWELKVIRVPAMSSCPGTVQKTTGLGMIINLAVVSGTNYQTSSLNQWISGEFNSGTGEDSTWLTGTTHNFAIAGLMVVSGDWRNLTAATYRYNRAFGSGVQGEVAMINRYFESSYGLNTGLGALQGSYLWWRPTSVDFHMSVSFAVEKRINPTGQVYSTQDGQAARIYTTDGATNRVAAFVNPNVKGADLYCGTNTVNQLTTAHWHADARF